RNDALEARDFFSPKVNGDKQNEGGWAVGGPVVIPKVYDGRNKTFFFTTYDIFAWRLAAGGQIASVPTQAMREGDFTQLLGPQIGTDILGRPIFQGEIYDPSTTRPDGKGGFVRDPFMCNGQLNAIC